MLQNLGLTVGQRIEYEYEHEHRHEYETGKFEVRRTFSTYTPSASIFRGNSNMLENSRIIPCQAEISLNHFPPSL